MVVALARRSSSNLEDLCYGPPTDGPPEPGWIGLAGVNHKMLEWSSPGGCVDRRTGV